MSDEQELKLACLHHAGGDLDHAKALFEWVSGSVRATTDSEAPEVSAPDQDKPEEPFNYRHPSKFGTDIPRRCHLEELTPKERAIRDLVGTVESLGAHPLLTTTVIQLMKAGESLADWVDIELRDKAISALQSLSSGEGGVGLLDGEPEPVPTEVRTQDEQDAAGEDSVQIESGLAANLSKSNDELLRDIGVDPETGIYTATGIDIRIGAPQEAPAIPEGESAAEDLADFKQRFPGFSKEQYRPLEAEDVEFDDADYQSKLGDASTPQTQPETSALDKVEDAPPGGGANVFLEQAEAAILDKSEDELAAFAPVNNTDQPATTEQLEAENITQPVSNDFAKGLLMEAEAKVEPKRIRILGIDFGAKKLVGEGV